MNNINLETIVYRVIYLDTSDIIKSTIFADFSNRITLDIAGDMLEQRGIKYKEVIKSSKEDLKLSVPLYDLKSYLVD